MALRGGNSPGPMPVKDPKDGVSQNDPTTTLGKLGNMERFHFLDRSRDAEGFWDSGLRAGILSLGKGVVVKDLALKEHIEQHEESNEEAGIRHPSQSYPRPKP